QAIAIEIEKIIPNRPMTHDLFKSFANNFHFTVEEIIISDLKEGVFFAKIVCSNGLKRLKLTLALLMPLPSAFGLIRQYSPTRTFARKLASCLPTRRKKKRRKPKRPQPSARAASHPVKTTLK